MALWEYIGGIYGKVAMLWRFLVGVCKKLEAVEQDVLLLMTRDDVKIHEEVYQFNMTMNALRGELNAIHVRLGKTKTAEEEKDLREVMKRKGIKKDNAELDKVM